MLNIGQVLGLFTSYPCHRQVPEWFRNAFHTLWHKLVHQRWYSVAWSQDYSVAGEWWCKPVTIIVNYYSSLKITTNVT